MVYGDDLEVLNSSVLDNDFFEDTVEGIFGKDLLYKAELTSPPSHGEVKFNEDGTFIYSPNNENVTNDKFTYRLLHNTFSENDVNVFIIPSLLLTYISGTCNDAEFSSNNFKTLILSLQYVESKTAFSSYANLKINLLAASDIEVG